MIHGFAAGNDARDQFANAVVVFGDKKPVYFRTRAESSVREVRGDGWLTQEIRRRRSKFPSRRVDDAHGIFDGDELVAGFGRVTVRAGETRKDESRFSGDEVGAVKFG